MVEKEQERIVVRVQPSAGQNQVLGFKDGVLHLRIAAPPVKGKANQELIKFLSDILGVSKSNLTIEKGDMPLIIDQPEGNLDNYTIAQVLIDCIRAARENRQVFIVTHNPNLVVVCDADQVIYASMDKVNGNKITYTTGALENPIIALHVTDVLEGTRWAFDKRGAKYEVAKELISEAKSR